MSDQNTTKVISISGASGIGKTTFCKKLKKFGAANGVSIEHIETDNWIFDRTTRAKAKIHHGYYLSGFYLNKMIAELDMLIFERSEIEIFPYDHSTGKAAKKSVIKHPAELILLDGSISMLDFFVKRYRALGLFFDATPALAKGLKHYLNLTERNYEKLHALKDAKIHDIGYREYCQPQITNADKVIELKRFKPCREYRIKHDSEIDNHEMQLIYHDFIKKYAQ